MTGTYQVAENQTEPTRLVGTGWDEHGQVTAQSVLSPTSMPVRAMCLAPSNIVVPIIFLPGIMGTRLRNTKEPDTSAWMPPEHWWEKLSAALQGLGRNAARRQQLLNPRDTVVDDSGPSHPSDNARHLLAIAEGKTDAERARWRGWGQLHGDSYGDILNALEERFAMIYDPTTAGQKMDAWWSTEVMGRNDAAKTGAQKPFSPLTEAELQAAADVLYPVHAVGYNWLQSNQDSGKHVLAEIKRITQHYRDKGKHCDKVVLVTHSMGGLVARACAQQDGAADLILGIVHGVMPANGAPASYKRIRAGFEGAAQVVLGRNAADCTAVMANAPGPLELLPMKSYRAKGPDGQERHWLRASHAIKNDQGSSSEQSQFLGEVDPYKEIYLNNSQDSWWRLVKEELINPLGREGRQKRQRVGSDSGLGDEEVEDFSTYALHMDAARKLHDIIEGRYHPNTYASYAADAGQPSWNEVVWQSAKPLSSDIRAAQTIDDDLNGEVTIKVGERKCVLEIDEPRGPGDGTVPAESGAAPTPFKEVIQIFRHEGQAKGHQSYDHQYSYQHELVQAVTLYSIVKIVSGSDWLKQNACHA